MQKFKITCDVGVFYCSNEFDARTLAYALNRTTNVRRVKLYEYYV